METSSDPALILEGKALGQFGIISIGTYVAVQLDPVATLSDLDDPEVGLLARQVQTKIYLALVATRQCFTNPITREPELELTLLLVGEGMPSQKKGTVVQPHMCTPIHPTTDHFLSREPVTPSKPLPWENCYQHSFMNVTVRIARIDQRNDSSIHLSADDAYRLINQMDEDRKEEAILVREARFRIKEATQEGPSPSSQGPHVRPSRDDNEEPPASPSEFYVHGSEPRSSEFGKNSVPTSVPESLKSDFIKNILNSRSGCPVANIWLDLSLIPQQLPDPNDFFDELGRTDEIEEESHSRLQNEIKYHKRENQARVKNWLQDGTQESEHVPAESSANASTLPGPARSTQDTGALEDHGDTGEVRPITEYSRFSRILQALRSFFRGLKKAIISCFRRHNTRRHSIDSSTPVTGA